MEDYVVFLIIETILCLCLIKIDVALCINYLLIVEYVIGPIQCLLTH